MDEHLKALIEKIRRFVSEDPSFVAAFNRKFTARKIVIRPAKNPDAVKNYYDASFTGAGELLIEYKSVWCNLSQLGKDFLQLLKGADSAYLANKSIREHTVKMSAYLQVIAGLLQTTNVTYDYCLAENLLAM